MTKLSYYSMQRIKQPVCHRAAQSSASILLFSAAPSFLSCMLGSVQSITAAVPKVSIPPGGCGAQFHLCSWSTSAQDHMGTVAGACTQVCIGKIRQVLKFGNQWVSCILPVAGRILGISSLPYLIYTPPQQGFSLAQTLGVLW